MLKQKHGAKLRLWSATTIRFNEMFFADSKYGRLAVKLVTAFETVAEPVLARFGKYPMFVITKSD